MNNFLKSITSLKVLSELIEEEEWMSLELQEVLEFDSCHVSDLLQQDELSLDEVQKSNGEYFDNGINEEDSFKRVEVIRKGLEKAIIKALKKRRN